MNAMQKVKHLILIAHARLSGEGEPKDVTAENIDAMYEEADGDDYELQDARNEVRCGEVETRLPCQWSRHYESKSVAAQMPDGSWVGWTYWYGGGKYGEPEAIDWIDEAYSVDCKEEEKLVTFRTFTRPNVSA